MEEGEEGVLPEDDLIQEEADLLCLATQHNKNAQKNKNVETTWHCSPRGGGGQWKWSARSCQQGVCCMFTWLVVITSWLLIDHSLLVCDLWLVAKLKFGLVVHNCWKIKMLINCTVVSLKHNRNNIIDFSFLMIKSTSLQSEWEIVIMIMSCANAEGLFWPWPWTTTHASWQSPWIMACCLLLSLVMIVHSQLADAPENEVLMMMWAKKKLNCCYAPVISYLLLRHQY